MTEVRPGQLWRMKRVLANSDVAWVATPVTDETRRFFVPDSVVIYAGDTMLVIVVDDTGPYETPNFGLYTHELKPKNRYHVVLIRDRLTWIRHDWLVDGSELVQDVPQ